jgi:hypothetical protein
MKNNEEEKCSIITAIALLITFTCSFLAIILSLFSTILLNNY